jgi:hypothetical protein
MTASKQSWKIESESITGDFRGEDGHRETTLAIKGANSIGKLTIV